MPLAGGVGIELNVSLHAAYSEMNLDAVRDVTWLH